MKTIIEIMHDDKKGFNGAIGEFLELKKCNETDSCNYLLQGKDWKLKAYNSPEDFNARAQEINQEFDSRIQIQHGERIASLENTIAKIKNELRNINSKFKLLGDDVDDDIGD